MKYFHLKLSKPEAFHFKSPKHLEFHLSGVFTQLFQLPAMQDSKCNIVIKSSIVSCYFDNISRTLIGLQDRNTKGEAEHCKHVIKRRRGSWQSPLICLHSSPFAFNLNINFLREFLQSLFYGGWNSSSDKTSLRWHQSHPSKSTFQSFIEHFCIYLVEPSPIPTASC